ncbi:hypothetical protein DSO57_1006401 [Entomophthora muscae]|uniref:Uncharacterized protein n=1 Tax=Entomophthora muscae TaxID=34485 RepID=A0ACC2TI93_9FUNG|nr:hypothetical protein DSO57_1006401 [Entomophthora muscae]
MLSPGAKHNIAPPLPTAIRPLWRLTTRPQIGFCHTSGAPSQPLTTPGSGHNQVGCRQPRQQDNGTKRPRKGELQLAQIEDQGKAWGL